jgi:hypothetical protein
MVEVILLVTFELTRNGNRKKVGSVRYARAIQMPQPPMHLDTIIVGVHTRPTTFEPKHVAWSQPRNSYLVTGSVVDDDQILDRLNADEHWVAT